MKYLLHFFTPLLCISATAQINFEKGYFINNTNEKTGCYIRNVDWRSNPSSFEYKMNSDDSKSLIGDISVVSEFAIDGGGKYKRYEVNIDKSEISMNNLPTSKYPVWQKETLFLKVLAEGDATLYYYVGENTFKFFYSTKTVPVEQLVYIRYRNEADNQVIKENEGYKQQLYNNVRIEGMVVDDFRNIEYKKNDLIKYFMKFNNLENPEKAQIIKKEKGIFKLKITAGVSSARMDIRDPDTFTDFSTDVSKIAFDFGAEVEYVLPFNKNKWSIFLNPTYQKFDAEKKFITSDGLIPPHYTEHTTKVDYTSISIPLGIRYYMFLNKDSKLFINAIYSLNLSSNSEIVFDDSGVMKIEPDNNAGIGLGYNFKDKFGVEFRVNFIRETLTDYINWIGAYTTIGAQLSYKIL